jgi:hypothetical protein
MSSEQDYYIYRTEVASLASFSDLEKLSTSFQNQLIYGISVSQLTELAIGDNHLNDVVGAQYSKALLHYLENF